MTRRPIDPDVRALWDRGQIEDVLLSWCRGVDRCDVGLIRAAYHPDSFDDHGVFRGSGHEFAEWAVRGLLSREQRTTHQLTNVLIDLDGDVARCESRFCGAHVEDHGPEPVVREFHGRYLDLITYDTRWAIAHRRTVYDWSEIRPLQVAQARDDPRFARGSRTRQDPVYGPWEPPNPANF